MSVKRKAAEAATDSAKKAKSGDIRSFFSSPSQPRQTRSSAPTPSLPPKSSQPAPSSQLSEPPASSPLQETIKTATAGITHGEVGATTAAVKKALTQIGEDPEAPLSKEEEATIRKPFDKKKWAEKLTAEQKELLGLEIETLHESWFEALKDELLSKDFLNLKRFLMQEHKAGKTIYPPAQDVYSWSRHTPLQTVKVVILGQDPYHGPNQAHGLCFSVRPPTVAPPSLKNIYTCLSKEYADFKPPPNKGGLLTPWADRGVLLLNAVLTVRKSEANSHAGKGWEKFTGKVIATVAKGKKGCVFVGWGSYAQKRIAEARVEAETVGTVKKVKKHLVLKGVHPSPLSAHRGFFECGHFTACNEWLVGKYGVGKGIDWSLDVDPEEAGV